MAIKNPSQTRQGQIATGEMQRYQPGGNAIDDVVEQIGECDAIYGSVYGK